MAAPAAAGRPGPLPVLRSEAAAAAAARCGGAGGAGTERGGGAPVTPPVPGGWGAEGSPLRPPAGKKRTKKPDRNEALQPESARCGPNPHVWAQIRTFGPKPVHLDPKRHVSAQIPAFWPKSPRFGPKRDPFARGCP